MMLHICPHWSRYVIREVGEEYWVLFLCDAPEPMDEDYGRGDLPRASECLLGFPPYYWEEFPVIGALAFDRTGRVVASSLSDTGTKLVKQAEVRGLTGLSCFQPVEEAWGSCLEEFEVLVAKACAAEGPVWEGI